MKIKIIIRASLISVLSAGLTFANSKKAPSLKSLSPGNIPGVVLKTAENSLVRPGCVIIKLNEPAGIEKPSNRFGLQELDSYLQRYQIQSVERIFPGSVADGKGGKIDLSRFYVLKFSSPLDEFKLAEELSLLTGVRYAEPWFIYEASDADGCSVNDPGRSLQYGLTKILADSAWCISAGDTSVIIGIVDSGIQWDHPDLAANIYINRGEYGDDGSGSDKQANNIDDDGNGKIDDWHGWDFGGASLSNPIEDNNPVPMSQDASHGTHVGGIAAAVADNSIGVAGLAYRCKLLPVKVTVDDDPRSVWFGYQGIVYAVNAGAKIINCSWGGTGASYFEQEIIDSVVAHGALVVAAAGNRGVYQAQYPASYRGVISVAMTTNADLKSANSCYHENVDVSAPGEAVYSTIYPSSYSSNYTGTSMSTAFVTGLAALVASQFPSYTNLQVGEQVRVTCDDIYSIDPTYRNMLGKGRINAFDALTKTSPSLRMTSFTIDDSAGGNNNRILETNENAAITVSMTNYLHQTTPSAVVTLSTADTNIQIVNGNYPVGTVGTLGTADNGADPFRIYLKGSSPPNRSVLFTLTMTDGGYSDAQSFTVIINPPFSTHDVNNVRVSLTNKGRVGFLDLTNVYGDGFVFGDGNQLYEGGLIVGYSSTKLVNVIRNLSCGTCQDNDFTSTQIYNLITPGDLSAQDGSTMFTDDNAPVTNRIGLQINMYSYAFTGPNDSNLVILRYDIKNKSGSTINNLFAGLFFDWDILGSQAEPWLHNRTVFDPDQNTGYAWNEGTPNTVFCGARAFEGNVSYNGLINDASLVPDRASKWQWISTTHLVDSIQDIHMVISSGPFTIADGATRMIGFALLGGKTLLELQDGADAALIKWNYIKASVGIAGDQDGLPAKYSLDQNFPNPFNPVTTVRYGLPRASHVTLKVYDVLGREVETLIDGTQDPGFKAITFSADKLPSGVYFYRLHTAEYTDTKKLLLLR